jgi:hypothetical protein
MPDLSTAIASLAGFQNNGMPVLHNDDVSSLLQLREHSLFVSIGKAALKLKHGSD